MSTLPPFAARPLNPEDLASTMDLACQVGVHGVYIGNFLSGEASAADGGEVLVLAGRREIVGLAYFGSRGNLIVVQREPLDGVAVARAVHQAGWLWRIVLGPRDTVAALAAMESRPALVHRRQIYYAVAPADVPSVRILPEVRSAQRKDQARLLTAALDLNAADLQVDPKRVHKPWLRDSIRRRIKASLTLVLGPLGQLESKLDIGSSGRFGMMVEGVYTFPMVRGRGLATGLVATVAQRASAPLVCLHVAEDNAPARRAYEGSGMTVRGQCDLLLRS